MDVDTPPASSSSQPNSPGSSPFTSTNAASAASTATDKSAQGDEFSALLATFHTMVVILKNYWDAIKTAIDHVMNHDTPHAPQVVPKPIRALHTSSEAIFSLLTDAIKLLRGTQSFLVVIELSTLLADAKEGLSVVENQLEDIKWHSRDLEVMDRRLRLREGRYNMISAIYENQSVADAWQRFKLGDFTEAFCTIPTRKGMNSTMDIAHETAWPEQLTAVSPADECAICRTRLGSAIIASPCCKKPFDSHCIIRWVREQDFEATCPLCRSEWDDADIVTIMAMQIVQWELAEKDVIEHAKRQRLLQK